MRFVIDLGEHLLLSLLSLFGGVEGIAVACWANHFESLFGNQVLLIIIC